MTAPLINQAKHIAFLVFGEKKAQAVQRVMQDPVDQTKFPAQLIQAPHGDIHWFLDKEATKLLS